MQETKLWNGEIAIDNLDHISFDAALTESDFSQIIDSVKAGNTKDLSARVPALNTVMNRVKEAVVSGFRFCIVDGLRFENIQDDPALLHAYILQLCACIGRPTNTDQKNGSVVWPIKPISGRTPENATYSQHHDKADLHTDTQYFPDPEEVMTLWCLHPDNEGQGENLLADGRMVMKKLRENFRTRVNSILSQPVFPFKVPSVFTKEGTDACVEVFVGPILSEKPLIRYRRQTIDQARSIGQYTLDSETLEALDAMDSVLATPDIPYKTQLKRGQALFVNNHEILHGRTGFRDMERHLLRVRLNF